ncbi:MAG: protein-export chaperone SecB [Holosporales bacterium]|jgi:preprotein translocase subunit SecB|nr:protein-export chaperone SecB [Holosporales bacterium]
MTDNINQTKTSQYPFYIHDQYIKDLSFENPNFLLKYNEPDSNKQPEVAVNVETRVAKLSEENYEVSMTVSAKSTLEKTSIFVLELTYAGLVSVAQDLKPDILETSLLVHCPFLMFPFVREIIANVTRNGGYPPLMIDPIDFASLYLEKKKDNSKLN